MRVFKFRAWDGKKMHYNVVPWQWDFVIDTMSHKCIESNGSGILGSGGSSGKFEVPGIAYKDLMQFSGLMDKNKKEIYEGDIFRYILPDMDSAEIEYTEVVSFVYGSFDLDGCPVSIATEVGEVIGNIYENPNLIQSND